MRRLVGLLFILCSFSMIFNANITLASDVDGVYLNGTKISFGDAQPMIYQGRTMVPVRATADAFGMVTEWNKETETMTFTKNDRVIVHKMRTNVITVNGEAVTFDVPSINNQNRTLMPVRMLAEAMGANVDWDADARQVIINTDVPSIIRAEPSVSAASSGQSVLVTIVASANTEKVKIVDNDTNTMVNESFVYNENGDGTRVFTMNWIPSTSTTGYKTVCVYPGTSGGYSTDSTGTQNVTVSVAADSSPQVVKYEVSDYSVDRNDYVTFTVYTNLNATRVKIENDFNASTKELTSYTTSGENRVFSGNIKMSKSGDREMTIYTGNAKGYASTYTNVVIDVSTADGDDDDDDDDDDDCTIKDIDVSDDEMAVDGEVTVKVTTTYDIEEINIYNDDDERVAKTIYTTSKDKDDNEKIWTLSVPIEDEGTCKFFVYAYVDNDETYKTFKVKGVEYDDDELAIKSITQKTSSASEGDTVSFTATTTLEATRIEVENYNGKVVATVTSGTKNGTSRVFTFKITDAVADRNYTLYAFDSDDDDVTKKFMIDLDDSDDLEITNVDVDDSTVDIYDDIDVEVRTSKAATKVWIENPDGDKVKSLSSHTKTDDDEYVWDFSFEADEEGKITYTVYAKDSDGNTVKEKFTVRVED